MDQTTAKQKIVEFGLGQIADFMEDLATEFAKQPEREFTGAEIARIISRTGERIREAGERDG